MTYDQSYTLLADELDESLKKNVKLTEFIQSILSIEEEGHRFDSDEALAEIFNKCRDILD